MAFLIYNIEISSTEQLTTYLQNTGENITNSQDSFIGFANNLQFGQNLANWIARGQGQQVPEPGTLLLMGLGLAGLGIARKRSH